MYTYGMYTCVHLCIPMYTYVYLCIPISDESELKVFQLGSARDLFYLTAIPYRASTGRKQGFPCVLFPHKEKPVFIIGFPGDENRFFPVRKNTQGKPCSHFWEITYGWHFSSFKVKSFYRAASNFAS